MDYDSSWCPVCDRQILPKRSLVPIAPPPPPAPAPAPPPSSPQSSPNKAQSNARRSKGTIRQKAGGLVQGTGRMKPNGTIKRTDSKQQQQQTAQPAPAPAAPIKYRTVIDQGPIPLYCSDECRMADLDNLRGLPLNYNPEREGSHPIAPIPRKSYSPDSDSDSGSSVHSRSSVSSSTSPKRQTHPSPSIAKLAEMYNFPPIPPPAPVMDDSSSSETEYYPHEYNSGIMMAGKFLESLCPKPVKQAPTYGGYRAPVEPRKPVQGWTDGSNAWRATVYSLATPKNSQEPLCQEDTTKAYGSFVATPHRSRGVYSTVGESRAPTPRGSRSASSTSSLPASTNDMLSKYSQSFRRSESRSSLSCSPSSVSSFPLTAPAAPQRRERSLLPKGAEGKLLVPNVKMKVRSGSSASLSSGWSGPLSSAGSRRSVRSPLSATSDDYSDEDAQTQRCDSASSMPNIQRRPAVETRSWSYDNLKTYPIMQLPPKREKRKEKQVVDGQEVEIEYEVVVEEPRKRLFLFPASTAPMRV
ncbi:hypothetical protein BDQ12DRAFT_664288 [Crucibulum laeve]|uniref:Uncharacterized protein n=1 Tax=Crucibulum laeve TaxID=68775 RepID=A0A5C3M5D8_9AGAR|nr:hypothetical protein BDQ12DRAFT_664288 [Crucibulum laeve]